MFSLDVIRELDEIGYLMSTGLGLGCGWGILGLSPQLLFGSSTSYWPLDFAETQPIPKGLK